MADTTGNAAGSPKQEEHRERPPVRRKGQLWNKIALVAYIWVSFVYIFGINYVEESRAYRQLNSEPSHFFSQPAGKTSQAPLIRQSTWDGNSIYVHTYHENYSQLKVRWETGFGVILIVIGAVMGTLAYFEDRFYRGKPDGEGKWIRGALLAPTVVLYYGMVVWMRYGIYPDMTGILITGAVYIALFFVIWGIQRFNPHVRLSQQAGGSIDPVRYKALLSLYQRYFIMLISVLGFVAASLLVGASGMLHSRFVRTGPISSAIYHAVDLPYLQAFYAYAAFACVALGFGAIKEMHGKIDDLLSTPVKSE